MQVCEGIRELLQLPAEKSLPERIFWCLPTSCSRNDEEKQRLIFIHLSTWRYIKFC